MTFFKAQSQMIYAVNQLTLDNLQSDVALVGNVGSYIIDWRKTFRPI